MSFTISNSATGHAFVRDFYERSSQLNGPDLDRYLFPEYIRQALFPTHTVSELLNYLARLRRIEDVGIVECEDERFGVPVFSSANLRVIGQAADLAQRAHRGQERRRSKADYFEEHIMRVVQIAVDLGIRYENACCAEKVSVEERALVLDTALIVAALLHDTFEDSRAGVNQCEKRFAGEEGGVQAIQMAASLTKLNWREYLSDAEADKRLIKELAELFYNNTLSTASITDVFLKCCDRFANISSDWVSPDYTDNRYALETAKPFQYFFSRLVAELPHGGVMLSFRESFELLVLRLVETSYNAARDLPHLTALNQSPASEQKFLSSEFSYDPVRYRAQESVRRLIPAIQRFSGEVEQRDASHQNEWIKLLASSLQPVLACQMQSEAVEILGVDLLGSCRESLEELKRRPSHLRTLLPRTLSELISCGDSHVVHEIDEWEKSWLHALSDVLAAIREISLLEGALAHDRPLKPLGDSQEDEAGSATDYTKLRLARELRDSGAESSSSFPQLIDNLLEQGPPRFAGYLDAYARELLQRSLPNESASASDCVQPDEGFIRLLRILESYQTDLRSLREEKSLHSLARQKQSDGSFITRLLRSQESITIGQDATFVDLVHTLRDFVQTWRSSNRPQELKLCIANPGIFRDLLVAQEALADRSFFSALTYLSKQLWGSSSEPQIKVLSDLCAPMSRTVAGRDQRSQRSYRITFQEMLTHASYADSPKWTGELLASSYVVESPSRSGLRLQQGALFFAGRVVHSSLLPDRLVDLITEENVLVGKNGEVDLQRACNERQYRIILVTATEQQAAQLRRECLDPQFFFNSAYRSNLEVYDFGSSLDHLASQGRGDGYLWLSSTRGPLMELRILPQSLLENERLRNEEELKEQFSSLHTQYSEKIRSEPWRDPLRELVDSLVRGTYPELSPNTYLQVVRPRPLRRPRSLVRHSVSVNSPAS